MESKYKLPGKQNLCFIFYDVLIFFRVRNYSGSLRGDINAAKRCELPPFYGGRNKKG